ncbi:MAG TPA: four helix bundle protein [Trueperaceae bacterium]|nr:four helix bundle protein [Trueperaceae bacterium]
MATTNFTQLIVWQKAHSFALGVYKYSKSFPKEEVFALTSQFRRAAVSIAANISEGYAKRGKKDKANFYNMAQGSLGECKYYLILAKDLGYGENQELLVLAEEIARLLNAYISALKRNYKAKI